MSNTQGTAAEENLMGEQRVEKLVLANIKNYFKVIIRLQILQWNKQFIKTHPHIYRNQIYYRDGIADMWGQDESFKKRVRTFGKK